MTERQVGCIDRRSAVPRAASERAIRSAYSARCCGLQGRPGSRRDRVVRWSFKVRDGCS